MRRKVWLIFCIGIILITGGIIIECFFPNLFKEEGESKEEKNSSGFSFVNTKKLGMCQKQKGCELEDAEFSKLTLNTSIKEVSEKIKNINEETDKYYEIVKTSTTSLPECEPVKKEYQRQTYVLTNYQLYQDAHIISIAVNRTIRDLCTDTYKTEPYDILIYDKNIKTVLTESELLSKIGYTEETIQQEIMNSIQSINTMGDYTIAIEDVFVNGQPNYSLFYNEEGFLVLAYQVKKQETFDYEEITLGN